MSPQLDYDELLAPSVYSTGLGTGMLYSRATFSRTSFARNGAGRVPKSRAMNSRDLGQVELPCGKSLDHLQLSAPHHDSMWPPTASLKKVAYTG